MHTFFWILIGFLVLLCFLMSVVIAFQCGQEYGISHYGYIEEDEDDLPKDDK